MTGSNGMAGLSRDGPEVNQADGLYAGCLYFIGAQDSRGLFKHFPVDRFQSFDPRLAFIFLLAALFFEQRDLELILHREDALTLVSEDRTHGVSFLLPASGEERF